MGFFRWMWRNKLASSLCLAFLLYHFSPLFFNRAELPPGYPQNKCNKHLTDPLHDPAVTPRPNPDIKVIRLTNSGEFVDRCELTDALDELVWDRSPNLPRVPNAVEGLQKLVVLYIHGWKHSADEQDSDLRNFTKMINSLRQKRGERTRVVGIYVGWNADAGLWNWLETMSTFWVKKGNADRIAQSSSVTHIVGAIGAIVDSDPRRADQFIAIGHSFGARVLFSATSQPLVTSIQQAHPGYPGGTYKIVKGTADAIILLNPAFEASRYSALNDFIRNEEQFDRSQPPLLISISSTGDWATQTAFPIGQWFGLAWGIRERQTIGNYKPFWTHSLTRGRCDLPRNPDSPRGFEAEKLCLQRLTQTFADDIDQFNNSVSSPNNPLIMARTSPDIIKDHNDIWNDDFRDWLTAFVASLKNNVVEATCTPTNDPACYRAPGIENEGFRQNPRRERW